MCKVYVGNCALWVPPPVDFGKLNFDGSKLKGLERVGYRGLIHDSNGVMILILSGSLPGVNSNLAKAVTLSVGCKRLGAIGSLVRQVLPVLLIELHLSLHILSSLLM
eukprot:TRINITY_DN3972_c0_g2_i1.p1 TRINITY_DN3972_c0_g2~~TRINITY_DN3972_c0_g2_i1.p1  ORF type:complete len:107 (+),score=14.87 TRINITY_DN3972_c0_g2_i1:1595-1915(+)